MANPILPGVYETISDGNLNLVTAQSSNTILKLGVCTGSSLAPVNVPQAFGSQNTMVSSLGAGALVQNLAYEFSVSGPPVLCMPVNPSQAGSLGAGVHTGTGTGTITAVAVPFQQIAVKVTTGGASGKFALSLGNNAYGTPITFPSTPFQYVVPGSFTTITFSDGGTTFVTNDVYTLGIDGYITHSGTGTGTITQSSSPVDNYVVSTNIVSAGTTPQFTYSLDGSVANTSPVIPLTSSGLYGISGSGIALQFSGSFNVGDGYNFLTCGPSFSNTDLTNALNAIPVGLQFSMVEVVRGAMVQNAVAAATEANTLDLKLLSLFSNSSVSTRGIIACPTVNGASVGFSGGSISTVGGVLTVDTVDTDGYVISSFQSFSDNRIIVAPGDELLDSPLDGLSLRRPASWVLSATLSGIPPAQDAGWVGAGALKGISLLFRNEAATPALSPGLGQRFTTLRTVDGASGFYFTSCVTMAQLTSDFSQVTNCRVVDKACAITKQWGTPLINGIVATTTNKNAVKGSISKLQAAQLNNSLMSELSTAMVPNDCVAVKAVVDETHNIQADRTLPINVGVQPYGYSEFIDADIGLVPQV